MRIIYEFTQYVDYTQLPTVVSNFLQQGGFLNLQYAQVYFFAIVSSNEIPYNVLTSFCTPDILTELPYRHAVSFSGSFYIDYVESRGGPAANIRHSAILTRIGQTKLQQ